MNATIRAGRAEDIGGLVQLGMRFFEEAGLSDIAEWDTPSFMSTLAYLIDDSMPSSLLVVEKDSTLIGMAGSVMFPFYFDLKTTAAQEVFWFLEPEFRKGIGGELLDELEADAKRKGATVFISAHIAGHRDEAFGRVYARRGYRPSEATYIRRLSS